MLTGLTESFFWHSESFDPLIDTDKRWPQTKRVESPEDWEIFWKASEEMEFNYHLELEKGQELRGELNQAKNLIQSLESLLQKEKGDRESAQGELAKVQSQFQKFSLLAKQMVKEHEKIKALYPLHDLWVAKQLEIDRLKRSAELLPPGQSEMSLIQALIQTHESQRDELKWLLEDAEARFAEQSKRIETFEIEIAPILEGPAPLQRAQISSTVPEF